MEFVQMIIASCWQILPGWVDKFDTNGTEVRHSQRGATKNGKGLYTLSMCRVNRWCAVDSITELHSGSKEDAFLLNGKSQRQLAACFLRNHQAHIYLRQAGVPILWI